MSFLCPSCSETRRLPLIQGPTLTGARSRVSGVDAATGTPTSTPPEGLTDDRALGGQRRRGRCARTRRAPRQESSLLVPMRDQSALGGPQGPRVRIRTQCKGRGDGVCWSDKPVSHASWRLGPNHTPRRRRAAPRGKPRHNSQRGGCVAGRHGADTGRAR